VTRRVVLLGVFLFTAHATAIAQSTVRVDVTRVINAFDPDSVHPSESFDYPVAGEGGLIMTFSAVAVTSG
jgi:hypothetical protein